MKPTVIAVATLAAALFAGAAFAQQPGYAQPEHAQPGYAASPTAPGAHGAPTRGGPERGERKARRQARLTEMRAALRLRPEQEPAFRAFLQARRPDPAMMERRRAEHARMMTLSVPARMEARLARAPQREAMLRRRLDATRQFYAALSPDQQRAFDAYARDRMGRRHGGGRGAMGASAPVG